MSRKTIYILFLLLVFPIMLWGRSLNTIKSNPAYLWAESSSLNVNTASDMALKGLVRKLGHVIILNDNPNINKRLIESYISEILNHSEQLTESKRNDNYVMRYIHRDSIDNIFFSRKSKIKEMLSMAESAEVSLQIDIALRNLSWAEILLKSIPSAESMAYKGRDGVVKSAQVWISDKINSILKRIDAAFTISSQEGTRLVEVAFSYAGKPVRSLNYKFFNGKEWSGIHSVKDGRGVIENPYNTSLDNFKVKYESAHSHLLHIDAQIKQIKEIFLIGNAASVESEKERKAVEVECIETVDKQEVKNKILSVMAQQEHSASKADSVVLEVSAIHNTTQYEEVVEKFCKAVSDGSYFLPDTLFAEEGYSIFKKLIQYGNARLLGQKDLDFYRLGGEIYCRSIPMVFSYNGNSRTFIEDIVITFNNDVKITNITFSLDKQAAREIVSHKNWPEEARIILVTFLENYKTAYALERLDYISSIFDDQALIITGRVFKNANIHNEFMNSKYVSLTKYNKEQYINRLKYVFGANEFINISFTSSEVLMLGKGSNMYGIQLNQEYYSSNYSDKGYLFLMVDLKDHTKPVIHVRTWQTEPDKEFGVIGPYHF